MKRHNFKGMPASHGVTLTHRKAGGLGGGQVSVVPVLTFPRVVFCVLCFVLCVLCFVLCVVQLCLFECVEACAAMLGSLVTLLGLFADI